MSGSSQVASNGSQASLNARSAPVPAGAGFEQSLTQVQDRRREGGSDVKARGGDDGAGSAGTSGGSAKAQESRVTRDERETGDEKRGRDGGASQTKSDQAPAKDPKVSKDSRKDATPEDAPERSTTRGQGKRDARSGTGERSGPAARTASPGASTKTESELRVTRDGREAGDERQEDGRQSFHPADLASAPVSDVRFGQAAMGLRDTSGGRRDPALALAVDLAETHGTSSGTISFDATGRAGRGASFADEKADIPSPLPLPQQLQDDLMRVNAISQQVLFDKTANVGFAWENGHNLDAGEYGKLDPMKKAKLLASMIETKAIYFARRDDAVPSRNIDNDNEIVAALDRGIKTLHGDQDVQNFFEEQIGPEVRRRMWQPENRQLLSRIMDVAGRDLYSGGIFQRAAAAGKGPVNTMRSFALMAGAVRQVLPPDLYQQLLPGMQIQAGKFIIDHAARSAGEQEMQRYMGVGPLNQASVYDPAIVEPSIALEAALLAKRTGAPENEALRAVATVVAKTATLTRQGFKLDNALFKARDEYRIFRSFPGAGTMAWRSGLFHAANAVCSGMQIAANSAGKASFSAKDKAALAFQTTMAADIAAEAATKYMNAYPATSRTDFGFTVRRMQQTFFSPSNIENASQVAGGLAGLGSAVLSFMSVAKDHDVGSKILDTISGVAGVGANAAAIGESATYFLGHEDAVVTRGIANAVGRMIGLGDAFGEAASGARLAASVISGATATVCSVLGVGAAIGQLIAFIAKGNHETDTARRDLDSRLQRTIGMQIQLHHFTGMGGLPNPAEPPMKPYIPVPRDPGNG